jgi:hypothetical protein
VSYDSEGLSSSFPRLVHSQSNAELWRIILKLSNISEGQVTPGTLSWDASRLSYFDPDRDQLVWSKLRRKFVVVPR